MSTVRLTVTVLLVVVGYAFAEKPTITLHPQDTDTDSILLTFKCQASGSPQPSLVWYDAETQSPVESQSTDHSRPGVHINLQQGILTISNPEPRKLYKFYCQARNIDGIANSRTATGGLTFLDRRFQIQPSSKTVQLGATALMECQPPAGYPLPSITWIHNQQPVDHTPSSHYNSNLEINGVTESRSGSYVCRVQNSAGIVDSEPAVLTVDVTKEVRVESTEAGREVILDCPGAVGHPIVWRRRNGTIDSNRSSLTKDRLMIRDVHLSDQDEYLCVINNAIRSRIQLRVKSKPEFRRTPENQTVRVGETARLRCEPLDRRSMNLYWSLPDSSVVFPKENLTHAYVEPDGTLTIPFVQERDAGSYRCLVFSSNGQIFSEATLTVRPGQERRPVQAPGTWINISPVIGLPPANTRAAQGDELVLPCEVGNPRDPASRMTADIHRISWDRSTYAAGNIVETILLNQPMDHGRIFMESGGNLRFAQVLDEDAGNYTCIVELASRPTLRSNWTAQLTVGRHMSRPWDTLRQEILTMPSDLKGRFTNESSVVLTWSASHFANQAINPQPRDLIRYRVEFFIVEEEERGWQVVEEEWNGTEVQINGLTAQFTYFFLIRPRVLGGRVGWASAPLGPLRPKRAPNSRDALKAIEMVDLRDIRSQNLGPPRVRISWHVPNSAQLSPIIGGFKLKSRVVPLMRCLAELSAQEREGFCSLSVAAGGSGDLNERLRQMQDWLRADSNEYGDRIKSIEYDQQRALVQYVVEDFGAFRCYEYEIEPYSIQSSLVGSLKGRQSHSNILLTYENTPGEAPSSLCVRRVNETSLRISWDALAVSKWNGLLLGYDLYVQGETGQYHTTHSFDWVTRDVVIPRPPIPGPWYFTISARNCRGVSVRSQSVRVTVDSDNFGACGSSDSNGTLSIDLLTIGVVCGALICLVPIVICSYVACCRQRRLHKKGGTNPLSTLVPVEAKEPTKYQLEPLIKTPQDYGNILVSDMNGNVMFTPQTQDTPRLPMMMQASNMMIPTSAGQTGANMLMMQQQQRQQQQQRANTYQTYGPMIPSMAPMPYSFGQNDSDSSSVAPYATASIVPKHSSASATGDEEAASSIRQVNGRQSQMQQQQTWLLPTDSSSNSGGTRSTTAGLSLPPPPPISPPPPPPCQPPDCEYEDGMPVAERMQQRPCSTYADIY